MNIRDYITLLQSISNNIFHDFRNHTHIEKFKLRVNISMYLATSSVECMEYTASCNWHIFLSMKSSLHQFRSDHLYITYCVVINSSVFHRFRTFYPWKMKGILCYGWDYSKFWPPPPPKKNNKNKQKHS